MIERIARRYTGRWLQGYARGKLRRDPIFPAAFELLKNSPLPVFDLGCGIGLFEFYLCERGHSAPLAGCDFDAQKIAQAQRIAAAHYPAVSFSVCDLAQPLPPGPRGHVIIFDVLHYLPAGTQRLLLERVAERVAPGGLCVIRATPRDGSWRFRMTQLEECLLRAIFWMKSGPAHYSSLAEIAAPLAARSFSIAARPLWAGTPFNSHLLVLRAPAAAAWDSVG